MEHIMRDRDPDNKQNPSEAPTRQDPDKTYPQKDPKVNPELDPNEKNPRNPKADF
jgi:hypothetical protein